MGCFFRRACLPATLPSAGGSAGGAGGGVGGLGGGGAVQASGEPASGEPASGCGDSSVIFSAIECRPGPRNVILIGAARLLGSGHAIIETKASTAGGIVLDLSSQLSSRAPSSASTCR